MDKKGTNKQKPLIDLDEFDDQVSIWQLIPAGEGKALKKLKLIVESVLNGDVEKESSKPLSLLISGKNSTKIYAKAFLRGLGLGDIREIPAPVIQSYNDLIEFFHLSSSDTGYIISQAQNIRGMIVKDLYNVLTEGILARWNYTKMDKTVFPVLGTIVVTSYSNSSVPFEIKKCFTHQIEIEDYDKTQMELICLQRLLYSNIERENDKVLKLLTTLRSSFESTIQLLKNSVMVMQAEGKGNVLTEEHVKKASYFK